MFRPLPSHVLAVIFLLTGAVGTVVHIIHRTMRRGIYLTAPPGSIAAIVSLTSHSGFGDDLLPYDDQETITGKLHGLRFRLDDRTGAIVADETEEDGAFQSSGEDAKLRLLGPGHRRISTAPHGLPDLPFEPLRDPFESHHDPHTEDPERLTAYST